MTLIVVDVEADGPAPGLFSMVCFGAVVVDLSLDQTFYGKTRPISDGWNADALAVSGFSRAEHEAFPDPFDTMVEFADWITNTLGSKARPVFVSDNPCYDWQFINYYLWRYLGRNPFGYSGRRIGDLWAGYHKNMGERWKHLRKTVHDHNPVNDAKGNAEVLLRLHEIGMRGVLR